MMRESVFVCSCRLNETIRVAYVRAWDEDEAADIFLHDMDEAGILDASDVHVRAVASARRRAPVPGAPSPSAEPGAWEGITPGP